MAAKIFLDCSWRWPFITTQLSSNVDQKQGWLLRAVTVAKRSNAAVTRVMAPKPRRETPLRPCWSNKPVTTKSTQAPTLAVVGVTCRIDSARHGSLPLHNDEKLWRNEEHVYHTLFSLDSRGSHVAVTKAVRLSSFVYHTYTCSGYQPVIERTFA